MIKKKSAKRVTVGRKLLMNLATDIYNPTTKKFLHLCDGKLQNGPDPTNKKRPMHCGLGELYFAMTGKQPESTNVDEEDVINLAVELSPLKGLREAAIKETTDKLDQITKLAKSLKLEGDMENDIASLVSDLKADFLEDEDHKTLEDEFRQALDDIPGENDDGCGNSCSVAKFRERSMRVAAQLREAAELLPRNS